MQILKRLLRWVLILAFTGLLLAVAAVGVAYWLVSPRIPSVAVLKDYHMQVPLRVVTADGKLIATFGETRRIPVAIAAVPDRLKHAVLSAEDGDFYRHPGVDWHGIARAGFLPRVCPFWCNNTQLTTIRARMISEPTAIATMPPSPLPAAAPPMPDRKSVV